MTLVIDETTYNVPIISINRKPAALFKFAERTQDGKLHSEMIGQFYNYDLVVGQSLRSSDYAAFWVKLTEAVESHEITLPDEDGDRTFTCYFADVKDTMVKDLVSGHYFKGLAFSVIATDPSVVPSS